MFMDHLKDIDLIEMSAGRIANGKLSEMRVHLQSCAECAERLRQITAVDEAMGGWRTVDTGQIDVLDEVMDAIDQEDSQVSTLRWWIGPVRIAASIALSVTLGHIAARSLWHPQPHDEVTVADVEENLQLASLSSSSPVGLTGLLLEGLEPQEAMP
jgi:anti-sigma factor RsiW